MLLRSQKKYNYKEQYGSGNVNSTTSDKRLFVHQMQRNAKELTYRC